MPLCNIDEKILDPFQRYKMPEIEIKYQKNKTIIHNLEDVARSLSRHPQILIVYWSQSLGCGKVTDGLFGYHPLGKLQSTLHRFIKIYVLCDKCSNPETMIYAYRKTLEKQCSACGHVTYLDGSCHKLVRVFSKYV